LHLSHTCEGVMSHEPGERWDTLDTFTEPDHYSAQTRVVVERAPVVDAAPLPTQLAQPTGRRAELIYELLSWVNKAPIEQVEALAARTRNPSPIALVYIAGPYTAPDAWGVEQNVRRAEFLAYEVEAMGAGAVCPHTNSRYIDTRTPYGRKIDITLEMMRRCNAVLFTDDWRRSTGARGENAEAVRLGMPCFESLGGLRAWLSERGKRDGGA
jgi:hypothetical protein